jgi:hypothetical protein
MPPVVIVGTNSWVTVAQATAYLEARLGAAAWAALPLGDRTVLLISAFRWIRRQSALSIGAGSTDQAVKDAQCEAAWWLHKWNDEYEKRSAQYASGVRNWRALDMGESLEAPEFPAFLSDMLVGFASGAGHAIVTVSRDLADNASE